MSEFELDDFLPDPKRHYHNSIDADSSAECLLNDLEMLDPSQWSEGHALIRAELERFLREGMVWGAAIVAMGTAIAEGHRAGARR